MECTLNFITLACSQDCSLHMVRYSERPVWTFLPVWSLALLFPACVECSTALSCPQRINEKQSIIVEYESGKALPNQQIFH